ncbi:MAG: hypothetical protein AAGK97_10215, partial [Bacteroidota bacterium]
MKKLFLLIFLVTGLNFAWTQPCNGYFELHIDPTITSTTSAGKVLTVECKISLFNPTQSPNLELHTMQTAIGVTNAATSFISHSGTSTEMVGGQVATEEFPLNPPIAYNGGSYSSWLVYGHTVDGTASSPPQIIPLGDTACIATITLNFDGTQEFTDDPASATPAVPYIFNPAYFTVFPGNAIANQPLILNNFGTVAPSGFPLVLDCYSIVIPDVTVLKIDLFSFNGLIQKEGNVLNWSVMDETNVEEHILESKTNLSDDFETLYRVDGQNLENGLSEYTFLDE